jgi:hypothetical protein
LSVVGDVLRITIPEQWLAEAKYPVVVDPVVGTNTIGSQTQTAFRYQSGMTENGLMAALVVNQYYINEAFNGIATAHVYAYQRGFSGQCRPVLYTDIGGMFPGARRSIDEGNFDILVNLTDKPASWRSTTFNTSVNIPTGYIWFGVSAVQFYVAFDFGNKAFWWAYNNFTVNIPNSFPLFPDQRNFNYKISMYFTYTNPQNYIRTLTQGVQLTDNRTLKRDYRRTTVQTVRGSTSLFSFETFYRRCMDNVRNTMNITKLPVFLRSIIDQTRITENYT